MWVFFPLIGQASLQSTTQPPNWVFLEKENKIRDQVKYLVFMPNLTS